MLTLQTQHRRILQLEAEVEALRVDAGRQQDALMKQRAQTRAAEAQVQELQSELENNAGEVGAASYVRKQQTPPPPRISSSHVAVDTWICSCGIIVCSKVYVQVGRSY